MLNGKYDVFFPLETSQKPMFDLLGTNNEDKKHYVYTSGHYVPRKKLISEHLSWLEKYLKQFSDRFKYNLKYSLEILAQSKLIYVHRFN